MNVVQNTSSGSEASSEVKMSSAGGAVSPGQDVTPDGSPGGGGVQDGIRVAAEPPQD